MSSLFTPRFLVARDGTKLRTAIFAADTAATARGVCVLLHGQTEFIEKYAEVIEELTARGFAVATMDWRSQGGSARALSDTRKIHVDNFALYDSDLAQFFEDIVAPLLNKTGGGRPIALAHSMGGHILLRALHDKPDLLRAAILPAPMLRVNLRGHYEYIVRALSAGMHRIGKAGDFVWGTEERDPRSLSFHQNFVTRDLTRFARWQQTLQQDKALCVNGPTWSWLSAALQSMRDVARHGYAEKITTPMLVIGAGSDRVVDTRAVRDFAARLPNARYVEIPDCEHEILMERDVIRAQFWHAFDEFTGSAA